MISGTIPLRPARGFSLATGLATLAACTAFTSSRAQSTLYVYYGNGNRSSQGLVSPSPLVLPIALTTVKDQTATLGGTARFSVLARGVGPFSYQWYRGTSIILGATSDTLTLPNLIASEFTTSANGTPKYTVQVTNGQASRTSNAAGLYQDSIGAGLPDWWRQQHFGSLAAVDASADADGDGVTNGQEYLDGTQPTNAASRYGRVFMSGPPALIEISPLRPTYAPGSLIGVDVSHSGEIQFAGCTGTYRHKSDVGFSFYAPGGAADVYLKGLFGSMPVQEAGPVPTFTYIDKSPASVTGFATSSGGMWVAWGNFDRANGQPRTAVARYNNDDTLDTGFVPQPNGQVTGAVILPNGHTIVAGYFSLMNGQPRPGVAKFNELGAFDTTFAPNFHGTGSAFISTVASQRDGKILLGGDINDGSGMRYLVRLNASGTTDASFTTTTDSAVKTFAQQPDGKILAGGNFTTVNGTATPKLVRLNLDGTLDSSFSLSVAAGAVTSEPRKIVVQPDGKILVGGNVQVRLNGSTVSVPLARLNADGTLDAAFTQKVYALAAGLTFADITLQTDGRIVGVGTFTLTTPSVVNAVRFKPDGNVDPDCFVISRPNGPVYAVAAQVNGNLLIGGLFSDVPVANAMVNNHQYLVTSARMRWDAAEALAAKLGGHLASISSAKEDSFIGQTMLPLASLSKVPVWIGINDDGAESLFTWSSGEPVNYTNWHSGNPDNFGGTEDYGTVNWGFAYSGSGPVQWNDTPVGGSSGFGGNTDGPYSGIIEIDPGASPPTTTQWVAGRDLVANIQPGSPATIPNPNTAVPAWSYGYRATAASTDFTPYNASQRSDTGVLQGWERPLYCVVKVNASGLPGFYNGPRPLHADEMELHPGADGTKPVVRWTAPQSGTYLVTGFWHDHDWGGGDGCSPSIVVNGVSVFNGDGSADFNNGNGAFAAKVLPLNAGDTVDYVLDRRGGDTYDSTRFNATITLINSAADVWNAGADLTANEKPDGNGNDTTNPNPTVPQWSYGERSSILDTGLNLYTAANHRDTFTGTAADDAIEGFVSASPSGVGVNTGTTPIAYNYGFGPNLPFNPNDMIVFPAGSGGPYPVVRWTAPSAGRYEAIAFWHDDDDHGGNGISAHIVVNGGQIYGQDMDNGAGCSTVRSLDLKAGDHVDFLIGTRGDFSFDVTKFNAVIVRPSSSSPHTAASSSIAAVTTRAAIQGNDVIDWSSARSTNGDIAGNPFVVTSSAGVEYHVRKATTGTFTRLTQGNGWFGNFAPGDAVLNHGYSDGPVIIEPATRSGVCTAIGMQIMPNQNGPFVATLRAYDINGTLLGTVTANGNGNANADNSAVFIGLESYELHIGAPTPVENIHFVTIDTDTAGFGGDFAINQVSIRSSIDGSFSNPRTNFAFLTPTNSVRPLLFYTTGLQSIFAPGAPTSLNLTSNVTFGDVSFAMLESSADGTTFQPFGNGVTTDGETWSFPVAAVPPGQNYFRAMLRTNKREEARTHAITLTAPPAVTSQLIALGEVGQPFSYTGTATGALTGFTTTSLPAWATASFDANSSTLRITGTPPTGGETSVFLQPENAAGSSSSTLVINIGSPFSSWQNTNFTPGELANPNISGPLGDATGAGIENLMKYALGIPPKQPGRSGLPTYNVEDYGPSDYLTLVYTRDKSAQNLTYTVEVSGDIITWQSGTAFTTEVSRIAQPNNRETVTVRDNVASSILVPRFIRLRVTQ